MTIASTSIRPIAWFLYGVLVMAAAHKVLHKEDFVAALNAYQIVPASSVPKYATALAISELFAAVMMVVPTTRLIGVAFAILIFGGYMIAMASAIQRGRAGIDCGCSFGSQAAKLGWGQVVRNLIYIALAGATLLSAGQPEPVLIHINAALSGLAFLLLQESMRVGLANHARLSSFRKGL